MSTTQVQRKMWLVGFGLALAALMIGTTQTVVADDLPKVAELLEGYVKATGGKDAHLKIKNRVMHGTLKVPAAGIEGKISIYAEAPDKIYTKSEFPGMGVTEEGYDGEVAWSNSVMMGATVKKGDEAKMAERSAIFHSDVHWKKIYKSGKVLGVEEIDGKSAYKVELTPKEGKPETHYYDKETGLLLRSDTMVPTQMGEMQIQTLVSDYQTFDGVKMPTKLTQKVGPQEVKMEFTKIEQNVDMPKDRFELPAAVKAKHEQMKAAEKDKP